MMMALFSQANHTAIEEASATDYNDKPEVKLSLQKLEDLHNKVYAQLSNNSLDLFPSLIKKDQVVTFSSASTSTTRGMMSIQYMRPKTQAIRVERLMGRDDTSSNGIETRRHPIIELRVTPPFLAVELILSPYAWWDQQNFVGKLTIKRHKQKFYQLLKKLDGNCCIGYWRGVQLNEMHIKVDQLYRQSIWDEWLDTFDPGKDWFRIGMWYEPEADAISEANIQNELVKQIKSLYTIYKEIVWSSDNNFREFYRSTSPSSFQ